jgi:DNA-binding LacI/PurR family transcriptional regulator
MANVDGARAATAHLLERGCRRVAAVMGPMGADPDASSLRHAGYAQALEEAGIPADPSLHVTIGEFSLRGGHEAVDRLVASGTRFDGLFCATDTVALGALRALHEARLRVPEDVRVIGFDNLVEGEYSTPTLSTVDPDSAEMARTAVNLLVRRISGDRSEEGPREYVSPFRVVPRESTAAG